MRKSNIFGLKRMTLLVLLAACFSLPSRAAFPWDDYHWAGNTFAQTPENGDKWVQDYIEQMVVQADGTCWTTSHWDEAGRRYGEYKNGDVIGNSDHNINAGSVVVNGVTWSITNYSSPENFDYYAGTGVTGRGKSISGIGKPTALGLDRQNNWLMICDDGPGQHVVKFYDVSGTTPTLKRTFGVVGGVFANTNGEIAGEVKPKKFWGLSGCGTDASGNIYVSMCCMGGGIRCFNPDESLKWEVYCMTFSDMGDFVPGTNGTEIYGAQEIFTMDYSKPKYDALGRNQQWKLKAYTLNYDKYPYDMRLDKGDAANLSAQCIWYREISGQKFMFGTSMKLTSGLQTFKFNFATDGYCAIPSTTPYAILPSTSVFIDKNASIWLGEGGSGVSKTPVTGINANGDLVFGAKQMFACPAPFNNVQKGFYDPATDVMYLGGGSAANPTQGWGHCGPVIARYNNWSTTRTKAWEILVPFYHNDAPVPDRVVPMEISVEGNKMFVSYQNSDIQGQIDDGRSGAIRVFDATTGAYLDRWLTTPGNGSWLDIVSGAMKTTTCSNGDILVMREENWKSKFFIFRQYGTSTSVPVTGISVSPTSASVAINGTTQLTATVLPSNATNISVTWSSSNTSIATVNTSGLVTAVAAGTAIITVTTVDGGKTATCAVTVTSGGAGQVTIRARSAIGTGVLYLQLDDADVDSFNIGTNYTDYVTTGLSGTRNVKVAYKNDTGDDFTIDYIMVNGTTYQAENYPNSGYWNGSTCTSGNSEVLACIGNINFGSINFDGTSSSHVYNFLGINAANNDYEVFLCDVDVFPFAGSTANRNSMVDATDAQYVNVTAIDGSSLLTVNPGTGDEMFVWVEMKITEAVSAISQIDFTYNGYTNGSTSTHQIYVLKAGQPWQTSTSWVQVGSNQSFPASNITMTSSITSNIADYIDAYGNIIWGVYETTSNQPEHVNYIGMTVKYNPLKSADIVSISNNEKLNNTIQPSVNVFPNPAVKNSNMHIQLKGYEAMDNLDINIIDIYGRIVYNESVQLNRGDQTIDLNNESFATKGMYFLQLLNTTHGSKQIVKLLVE